MNLFSGAGESAQSGLGTFLATESNDGAIPLLAVKALLIGYQHLYDELGSVNTQAEQAISEKFTDDPAVSDFLETFGERLNGLSDFIDEGVSAFLAAHEDDFDRLERRNASALDVSANRDYE